MRPGRYAFLALVALGALAGSAAAHDLTGTVVLLAKGDKVQAKTAEAANAVVIFRPKTAAKAIKPGTSYQVVTRKKEFVPRMITVPVGSTVAFPNDDPILHNVFSVSGANKF